MAEVELPFRLPRIPELNTVAAEQLKMQEDQRTKDAIEKAAAVIDDVLEEFGLGHPAQALVEFLEDVSPYSILTRKLGIPAPGDVLDMIRYTVRSTWKQLPPLIQRPAGIPPLKHPSP